MGNLALCCCGGIYDAYDSDSKLDAGRIYESIAWHDMACKCTDITASACMPSPPVASCNKFHCVYIASNNYGMLNKTVPILGSFMRWWWRYNIWYRRAHREKREEKFSSSIWWTGAHLDLSGMLLLQQLSSSWHIFLHIQHTWEKQAIDRYKKLCIIS